jgi:hypothetical protein
MNHARKENKVENNNQDRKRKLTVLRCVSMIVMKIVTLIGTAVRTLYVRTQLMVNRGLTWTTAERRDQNADSLLEERSV